MTNWVSDRAAVQRAVLFGIKMKLSALFFPLRDVSQGLKMHCSDPDESNDYSHFLSSECHFDSFECEDNE